ncbi:hypothetical protein [Jiangella rhizosphaerae]|uniref:Uncharacterized protein n=1 Tax=Jiangella rhizosphaerae TaxID=2293569 RepID=A0A418KVX5_9ACTN|nr:hypothetical protein [Jiangella rhizosphaerae]RIQ34788.1 hypothetical protein DY240_03455 [Jiangella rhizosphaerae]
MTTPEESRFERWRRTAEAAAASAGETRARVIRDLAAALAVLVRRVKVPLLAVGLLPLPPALVLLVEGFAEDIGRRYFIGAAAIVAAPGLWVLWRRRRLVRAVDPVDELAAELAQAYDVAGAWARAGDALHQVRAAGPGLRGAGRAARGVWAGMQLTKDLFDRFSDLPRVAPFLPVSLQFTGYLCLASVVAAAVGVVLAVAGFGVVLLA